MSSIAVAILVLAAVAIVAFVAKHVWEGTRRASAANNVVAAAATYTTLTAEGKAAIDAQAEAIVRKSNWPEGKPIAYPTELAKWGWYALAMRELGVRPVCLTSHWAVVRNPFTALLVTDTMLDSAVSLAARAGSTVQLDRSPGLFELVAPK